MNYWSDERQRNGENRPRPEGLRRKSGHTLLSPLCLEQPNPAGSASSGRISARNAGSPARDFYALGWNAIHPSSVNRP